MRRNALAVMAGCFAAAALAAPVPLGDVVRVSPDSAPGAQHYVPNIARMPDGGFVAAWYMTPGDATQDVDVMARVFGPDGVPKGPAFDVNQTREGIQILASVAADARGTFTVAWQSLDGAPGYGHQAIYARRFNSSGAPLDGEFRVDTLGHQYLDNATVSAAPDGRFVVAWVDTGTIYARLFDAAGHPRGPEQALQGAWGSPELDVVMRDDGSFVAAYSDSVAGQQSIGMRGYDADGQLLFGRVQVSPLGDPEVFGSTPAIDARADGGVYVAWVAHHHTGGVYDGNAYVRRYDAAGNPLGDPQRVNDTPAFVFLSVGVADDGAATVAWSDDTDGERVYARSLDRNGTFDGPAFAVNDFPQSYSGVLSDAVAYDANGDFVIAWYQAGVVNARFYDAAATDPPPPPPEDGDDPGCDHDEESDEDHDNGCGNDPGEHDDDGCDHDGESDEDHDNGCGNDPDDGDDGDGAAADSAPAARAGGAGAPPPAAGSLNLAMLLLLGGVTLLRRRRPTGAGRTSGSPARC